MTTEEIVKQRFTKDVADHELSIERDDGLYRHLIFKAPGTNYMRFDLVTWPGYLAYTGDMGAFVFTRTRDMLEFFRREGRQIDYRYWGEKCVAADGDGGVREYSEDRARADVLEWAEELIADRELSQEDAEDLRRKARYFHDYETRHSLTSSLMETGLCEEPWEHSFGIDFTYRFIWACEAMRWAIAKYDAAAATAARSPEAV